VSQPKGPIWSTIGNIRAATAKAAADSFRRYKDLLPEPPQLDAEEIRTGGKPSPYGNMRFPNFVEKPEGGFAVEGNIPADHEAVSMMYNGDVLALLIARAYDTEEMMP